MEDVNLDDIVIMDSASMAASDEWAAYPDGIRIESYAGKTFNAHIMLIQDPSRVYLVFLPMTASPPASPASV